MCNEEGEFDSAPPQCLGVTKEDVFTTPTSTTTPPTQETSASSTSAGTTSTGPRDSSHTTSASSTVSLFRQGEDILRDADNTPTTIKSTMSNYSQGDQNDDIVDTKKDVGYTPVIISVVCVSLAACIAILFIHKLLNKRKGSQNGTAPIC
ncbi:location of vulva defective 1-like isoform X2 [Boleophthalmus pectinirostris]|uniref:location of vulva defective 1-like isoform X2 n=1 Tax=Boleophthalmus pectinirostris TaxID=150288 RepID=UPI002431A9A4|nr:location of vulva defective 1-like isoform X2 [Boleophthalmus pectinirostris]